MGVKPTGNELAYYLVVLPIPFCVYSWLNLVLEDAAGVRAVSANKPASIQTSETWLPCALGTGRHKRSRCFQLQTIQCQKGKQMKDLMKQQI